MSLRIAKPYQKLFDPVFKMLPLHQAMTNLVVHKDEHADHELIKLVERVLNEPNLKGKPELATGIWLYVDELDRSHTISQSIETATGSFWHAIMHRREGEFWNSNYWYRRTNQHPAMKQIDMPDNEITTYKPQLFVDLVEQNYRHDNKDATLIAIQRAEWIALFEWCTKHD
ncbi:hypothetical protein JD969_11175 [Planctomycetota bacterium]|nr:hypothetical protein JD969_11175 [Planctomycetota bacterium]